MPSITIENFDLSTAVDDDGYPMVPRLRSRCCVDYKEFRIAPICTPLFLEFIGSIGSSIETFSFFALLSQ